VRRFVAMHALDEREPPSPPPPSWRLMDWLSFARRVATGAPSIQPSRRKWAVRLTVVRTAAVDIEARVDFHATENAPQGDL
jgi:hypothetical protein